MAEDRIDDVVDVKKVTSDLDVIETRIEQFIKLIQSVKGVNLNIAGAKSVSEYNALRKELELLIKQTNLSAKAAIDEAKARNENAKAALNEAKARDVDTKAAERQAKASEKNAKKIQDEQRPYKQLALAFAAAKKEAEDLAAKYGTMDKRSQSAAKRANDLNNELKKIDYSIGNFQRNVGNYSSGLEGFGQRLKGLAVNFLSLIGVVGVGSIFSSAIDEFVEMDKNARLLENTLRNIGVPEAFDRIKNSADRLAKQFTYLDNDDILKSFNQLIVYGKLTEDQINELIPVIIDFAAATGQDINSATSTVIKALEGNGKALKEFGINMKDAKSTSEAFSIIMKDLKPRVDGVAESFADSAAGGLASAKQEFKNLKEELGQGLLPILNSVLSVLNKITKGVVGGAKAIKEFFSGGSLVGSIVEQSFADDKKAQQAVEEDVRGNFVFLQSQIDALKQLQAQGKKLQFTEDDIRKEFLNNLIKRNEERKKQIQVIKETGTVQDIKEILVQFAAGQRTINELQRQLSGSNVLGAGGKDSFGGGSKTKGRDLAEADRVAEFEILKSTLELRADINKQISEDESKSYSRRLLALNDYAIAKQELINATSEFEKGKAGLTAKEIESIEAQRISSLIKLNIDLTKAISKTQKETAFAADTSDIQVKGMSKSVSESLEKAKKDWDEYSDKVKENKEKIKEVLNQLSQEVQGLVFDLFTANIERQKNAVQDQIDLLEAQKQKDIEVANQTIANAQDRAAAIAVIEARAAGQREQLERRQRQLEQQRARFERARSIANIIQTTAEAVVGALAQVKTIGPAATALAILYGSLGAIQLARALATPIPRYKEGTKHHKGGLMEVGEGGKSEAVVFPDGTVMKTPATSTIMYGPPGTRVEKSYDDFMMRASLNKPPRVRQVNTVDKTEKAVLKVGKEIVKAVRSQPQTVVKTEGAWKKVMRKGNTFTEYLSNNL